MICLRYCGVSYFFTSHLSFLVIYLLLYVFSFCVSRDILLSFVDLSYVHGVSTRPFCVGVSPKIVHVQIPFPSMELWSRACVRLSISIWCEFDAVHSFDRFIICTRYIQ